MPKKGYVQTAEHRKKVGDAHRGRKLTSEHIKNVSNALRGKKKPPRTVEHNKKIAVAMSGRTKEDSNAWKGDKASYQAIHMWAYAHWGQPQECEDCGITKIPRGKVRWFEWANVSGEYKRIREDWKRLCRLCHDVFDNKANKK